MTHDQLIALGWTKHTTGGYQLDRSLVEHYAGFSGFPMLETPGYVPPPEYRSHSTSRLREEGPWVVWYAPLEGKAFKTEEEFDAYMLAARLRT